MPDPVRVRRLVPVSIIDFRSVAHPVEPNRPFINGKCFDDLWHFSGAHRHLMIERGVVFLTEFEYGGKDYGGSVIATDASAAAEIAGRRGLNEKIVGVMCEEVAG